MKLPCAHDTTKSSQITSRQAAIFSTISFPCDGFVNFSNVLAKSLLRRIETDCSNQNSAIKSCIAAEATP